MAAKTKALSSNVCVVYCRVSSDKQATADKVSLDEQERRGRATAGVRPILYVAKHAESAWVLDHRSKFQAILADARAGKFGVLIVDRADRFSRSEDLTDPALVLRELQDLGVQVEWSDQQYAEGMVGQLQLLAQLFASGMAQKARRKASIEGKRGRVVTRKHPLPGRRAPYGYRWIPVAEGQTVKTQLEKDPGSAQAVVDRIWRYFLHFQPTPAHPKPTMRGIAVVLRDDHVPPPHVYGGIHSKPDATLRMDDSRWAVQTIDELLHNGVYWGEPRPALLDSKYQHEQPPVAIPAYGPAYVTPAEAARVHAILAENGKHGGRPQGAQARGWGTLLHGGLAHCAYCGHRMDPMPQGYRRKSDGAKTLYYRCSHQARHGKSGCQGTQINAATLDYAAILTLDQNLRHGHYLERLFAAWEGEEVQAANGVRIAQAALDDAQQQVENLMEWAARTPPSSAAGATLQARLQQVDELLPGLTAKRDAAVQAAGKVRGNTALRDELRDWFSAWLGGFRDLSRERQREFLSAVHADVCVWRAEDRTPRAELVIGVPTDALELPPPPVGHAESDGWHLDLDITRGEQLNEVARDIAAHGFVVDGDDGTQPVGPDDYTADQVMADIRADLAELGAGLPPKVSGSA